MKQQLVLLRRVRGLYGLSRFIDRWLHAARLIGRYLASVVRWLAKERERTNFTYPVSPATHASLSGLVAACMDVDQEQVDELFRELFDDDQFWLAVQECGVACSLAVTSGQVPLPQRIGRRVAWYAIARILNPQLVVETGTDRGLGTAILARAVERNGSGRVVTVDIESFERGALVPESLRHVVKFETDHSHTVIPSLPMIDMFIHDSDHSYEFEHREFELALANLSPDGILLTDNAEMTDALVDISRSNNRRFLSVLEHPEGHWHRGGGLGVSWVGEHSTRLRSD